MKPYFVWCVGPSGETLGNVGKDDLPRTAAVALQHVLLDVLAEALNRVLLDLARNDAQTKCGVKAVNVDRDRAAATSKAVSVFVLS